MDEAKHILDKAITLIIEKRKQLGWSQDEVAKLIDITQQGYGKLENGQSTPKFETIMELMLKLDIDPITLFTSLPAKRVNTVSRGETELFEYMKSNFISKDELRNELDSTKDELRNELKSAVKLIVDAINKNNEKNT